MEKPLTPAEIRRLCEAAGWEASEATGDTSEIDALIARAERWADQNDEYVTLDSVLGRGRHDDESGVDLRFPTR